MVYWLHVCPLNGSLSVEKIDVKSEFASVIKVYRTGNIVSVDIDGKVIINARTVFATGLPGPIATTWANDLLGHNYRVYANGDILCTSDLTEDGYVNLHFTYIAK